MTGTPTPPVILLSDKLMTITNRITLVHVKLDMDEMNYSSWMYLFKTLCKAHELFTHILDPQTDKQAWDFNSDIFNDNKRTRSIVLKAELQSLKLDDLTIDAYFCKIESIATILTSLESPINNDDVVIIALEGLPDKYDNVSRIIGHREPFPDLKTVHSMLTTNAPSSKVASSPNMTPNDMMALIQPQQALLAKLGYNGTNNIGESHGPSTMLKSNGNTTLVALHTSLNGQPLSFSMFNLPIGLSQFFTSLPFWLSAGQLVSLAHLVYGIPSTHQYITPAQYVSQPTQTSQVGLPGQGPTFGNWNMDTGVTSHLNDSISSLSDIFNLKIYPYVFVGDGYSINVTNSGDSSLPTPHQPLHLNNVIITPNIFKNLIYVRQFIRDNHCTVEFDAFGFSVKDFITCWVLLRCDSTRDLYLVTYPFIIPHAFLTKAVFVKVNDETKGFSLAKSIEDTNVFDATSSDQPAARLEANKLVNDGDGELEMKVLVDSKQDDAKVVKVVGVSDEQNSDVSNVLEGNGVIGVGANENNKGVDKEVKHSMIEPNNLIGSLIVYSSRLFKPHLGS
ncbi:hypothetical protein Tco_0078408 [Tanacetum coccineum]